MDGVTISKHELSAFFRKPGTPHYRVCQDQLLRRFLAGLQKIRFWQVSFTNCPRKEKPARPKWLHWYCRE